MNIAYSVRRAFPGPGGIATHMRVVATTMTQRGHHVRVFASRIDDRAFTRLNTNLTAQAFTSQTIDGVEVRPVPMGPVSMLASAPLGLMTVRGLRRAGYHVLRKATSRGYVASVGSALAT
jgi:hypothetical protein